MTTISALVQLTGVPGDQPLDFDTARSHIYPARWEMGLREWMAGDNALLVKCGIGQRSCWVVVTVNIRDLYDVKIMRIRGNAVVNLGEKNDIGCERLASETVQLWCRVCADRGW